MDRLSLITVTLIWPGVLELLLDVAGDLVGQQGGRVVVDLLGVHDHADLAARVHGVDLVHAHVAARDLLELVEALHVLLERLAAGTRPGAGQRVHDLDDHGLDGLRLDLVVVRLHRVRDRLGLLVAPRQLAAHERVRALALVRDRLADVVQQRGAGGAARVGAQLGGQHRREPRALDRVVQHVLAVARAELEPAQQLHELRVERADVGLEHRLLPHLDHVLVDLGLRLVEGLLDPGRMDAAVLEQLLEREPRDLAADAVEPGQEHRARACRR